MDDGKTEIKTKSTLRRTLKYSAITLGIFLSISFLACGSVANTPIIPETNSSSQVRAESTEEYLRSLPQSERMVAQARLDEKARLDLKLNAHEQLKLWSVEAGPKCDDFFGTANCIFLIIELERSELCPFKFSRYIRSLSDVKEKGHYYGLFVNQDGRLSGGYHWVASYNHQAYVDGGVLEITKCWARNPQEREMENP